MDWRWRRQLLPGLGVTSLGTLASRVLGMLRDMATAGLLGLSGDGVMDAFVLAFRIPNLFRRLFGEGALTAAYLPVFTAALERDRGAAWRLASVMLVWLALVLMALVVLLEIACAAAAWWWAEDPSGQLLARLAAVMMPYLLFVCIAAQISATLQGLHHFTLPALVPAVLNIGWLIAAWLVAPQFAPDRVAQAYVLAGAILISGIAQVACQWPALAALGFRFDYHPAAWPDMRKVVLSMTPAVVGLAVTQLNTFLDSLLAWGLSAPPGDATAVLWPGGPAYPMQIGAAAAIYFGERLYQFPLGMLGMAVATVIFPTLSRHAARGQHDLLAADLTQGLRLVLYWGIPASAGLVLLAEPITRLLFERGEFTADDTARVARMVALYGLGVAPFCAAPTVVRAFYALGDMRLPLRVAMVAMVANIVLNLLLVWPMAEAGIALSTTLVGLLQAVLLAVALARRGLVIGWPQLLQSMLRSSIATALSLAAAYAVLVQLPEDGSTTRDLLRVATPMIAALTIFFATAALSRAPELRWLAGKR